MKRIELLPRLPQIAYLSAVFLLVASAASTQKPKLPRPRTLEHGLAMERDSASGEMRTRPAGAAPANASAGTATIRTRVGLVEIGCTVNAPDGRRLRGLTQDKFRLYEGGVEQKITSFDAATTPASIVLVLDASPSITRELTQMRDAAESLARSLQPEDEVAVVAFANETNVLLPFSKDRKLLAAALSSPELTQVANSSESYIYQATYLTARELLAPRAGRKALVLLTDGQDSGLGLTWDPLSMQPRPGPPGPLTFEDVARELAADGVELHVISTENRPIGMTADWLAAHRETSLVTSEARRMQIPQYTLYLAEMVRQVGGSLYFLHELGGLSEVYRRIAASLGAEYTLGYYPSEGTEQAGWRELRIELATNSPLIPAGSQLSYRNTYYVPVLP